MLIKDIKEFLSYSLETGEFFWVKKTNKFANDSKVGKMAGYLTDQGYRYIEFRGQVFSAARLAWWYTTGSFPAEEIDHINFNKDDNRIENLRPATHKENTRYRRFNSGSSKFKGVSPKPGPTPWRAMIGVNGKRIHLGCFVDEETAARAYDAAALIHYGKFAELNFPESPKQ